MAARPNRNLGRKKRVGSFLLDCGIARHLGNGLAGMSVIDYPDSFNFSWWIADHQHITQDHDARIVLTVHVTYLKFRM